MEIDLFQATPVRVRWDGWESNTYTLRSAGWQVFAGERQSFREDAYCVDLSLRDRASKIMIHGTLDIPCRMMMEGYSVRDLLYQRGVDMQVYRTDDRIYVYSEPRSRWEAMDAMLPCDGFAAIPHDERRIGDLKLFKYTENPKEIYLPQASVDQCLNQILKLQFPERPKVIPGKSVEQPIIQAKIYSLAA